MRRRQRRNIDGMSKRNLKLYGQGLRGILYGYSYLGATTKATIYVGGKTGLSNGPVPEGRKIPKPTVIEAVIGARAAQIGPAAGATTTMTEGRYKGAVEPSYKFEFFHDGSEPNVTAFRRNIKRLAQRVAGKLGQREVYVELVTRGKTIGTYSATPPNAPPVTSTSAFCSWVRSHSKSARTNPADPCARKKRR